MCFKKYRSFLVFIFVVFGAYAQDKDVKKDEKLSGDLLKDIPLSSDYKGVIKVADYNPLAPAKAAFLSAILPGLGQAYNKRFWKIPIVYGALATSAYYYITNAWAYNRYRTAYKLRKADLKDEFTTDEGFYLISEDGLKRAQEILQRNKDESMLIFIGIYFAQILDAATDAHLLQFDISDEISIRSNFQQHPFNNQPVMGIGMHYEF